MGIVDVNAAEGIFVHGQKMYADVAVSLLELCEQGVAFFQFSRNQQVYSVKRIPPGMFGHRRNGNYRIKQVVFIR